MDVPTWDEIKENAVENVGSPPLPEFDDEWFTEDEEPDAQHKGSSGTFDSINPLLMRRIVAGKIVPKQISTGAWISSSRRQRRLVPGRQFMDVKVHGKRVYSTVEEFVPFLEIRPSSIPGAGNGVFTRKSISKGTVICYYCGKVYASEEAVDKTGIPQYYLLKLPSGKIVDASSQSSCLARFINDCRGTSKKQNVEFGEADEPNAKYAVVRSIAKIPAGGELFVSYGDPYWDV